jgi:hypothetical protein
MADGGAVVDMDILKFHDVTPVVDDM